MDFAVGHWMGLEFDMGSGIGWKWDRQVVGYRNRGLGIDMELGIGIRHVVGYWMGLMGLLESREKPRERVDWWPYWSVGQKYGWRYEAWLVPSEHNGDP